VKYCVDSGTRVPVISIGTAAPLLGMMAALVAMHLKGVERNESI
jgi:hypothetical protein